jgi:hypothetical protein
MNLLILQVNLFAPQFYNYEPELKICLNYMINSSTLWHLSQNRKHNFCN